MLSKADEEKIYSAEPAPLLEPKESWFDKNRLEIGVLAVVLLGAFALRFINMNRTSLWFDESFDLYVAYERSFIQTLWYSDPYLIHPPLFFPVMNLWMHLIGPGEFSVRFFSVLMAMITLVLFYFMARHWLGKKLALTATALLAVSSLHLYWSQSIRPYSYFTLLVVINMALAYYVSEKPLQNRRWLFYGLSAALLVYTHYLAFHLVFAQALFLVIVLFKERKALLRLGITLALVALSFLPYFPNFLEQARLGSSTGGYAATSPRQFLEVIEGLSSYFVPASLAFVSGALFLPLYLLGLVWFWQNQRRIGIWLALWSFLPVMTSWLSSFIRPNFSWRLFVCCLPAFLLIVAAGLWSLRGPLFTVAFGIEERIKRQQFRLVPAILLSLLIFVNLAACLNYNQNYKNHDWRGLVNHIVADRQEGDIVFLNNRWGFTLGPFDYYYRYNLGSPGNLERVWITDTDPSVGAKISEKFGNAKRVWMVGFYSHGKDDGAEWIQNQILPNIPSNYKQAYYEEFKATDERSLGLSLLVRT